MAIEKKLQQLKLKGYKIEKQKNGFANDVYLVEKNKKQILKFYNSNKYFESELMALKTNFSFKPEVVEYNKKIPYILMSFIESNLIIDNFLNNLAQSLVKLHSIKIERGGKPASKKITNELSRNKQVINKNFDFNISELIKGIKLKQDNSLLHLDITNTNIKIKDNNIYFIDFDEANFGNPTLDLACIYWSNLNQLNSLASFYRLVKIYNSNQKRRIEEKELEKWILLLGLKNWIWRYKNIDDKNKTLNLKQKITLFYEKHYKKGTSTIFSTRKRV